MIDPRYYACSASDRTDNWAFWFVADSQKGGINVTNRLLRRVADMPDTLAQFGSRTDTEKLARLANEAPE